MATIDATVGRAGRIATLVLGFVPLAVRGCGTLHTSAYFNFRNDN